MFAERLNDLMYHLCPATPGQIPGAGAWAKLDAQTRANMQRLAEKALRYRLTPLLLSDRLINFDVFAAAREERRTQLRALVFGALVEGADRYIAPMIDIIWAICEESGWGDTPRVPGPPGSDLGALETACLIAWTYQLAGEAISQACPEALTRMELELNRRVLTPFMGRELMSFTREPSASAGIVRVLCAYVMADRNNQRRWAGIRRALNLLEDILRAFPPDGVHPGGLEAWQTDAAALADAASLISLATSGALDLSESRAFRRLCDFPMSAHLGEGVFLNPDGEPEPKLCGETLFRVGECAVNAELKRLGAALNAKYPAREDAGGMTARVLGALSERAFRAEAAIFPARRRAFLRPSGRMLCAGAGFSCALHGGSLSIMHMDAGNFEIMYKGRRVFGDLGLANSGADAHSLPTIDGIFPLREFGGVKDVSARFEEAFSCLSLNLAPGFPDALGVIAWQRTLMLSPVEGTLRLIEAFDLSEPKQSVVYRFVTPVPPVKLERGYRLGGVSLTWEDDMDSRVEALYRGFVINVYAPQGVMRGNTSFIIRPV